MTTEMLKAQLADILVDWCEDDLDGDNLAGAGPDRVAQVVVECLMTVMREPSSGADMVIQRLYRAAMRERADRNAEYEAE